VITLSGVNFGHYGPKLVKHMTSVCGDFYSNKLDSQVNLKHNIEQTVAGIDQVTFSKLAKRTVKRVSAHLQRGGQTFMTPLMSLKKKNGKKIK